MKINHAYLVISRNKSEGFDIKDAEGVFWRMENAKKFAKQLMGPENYNKWRIFYKVVKFVVS